MSTVPPLTIAQIIADLNELQNTNFEAAKAFLNANKTFCKSASYLHKTRHNSLPDAAKFDSLGKRIVGPIITTPATSDMDMSSSFVYSLPDAAPESHDDAARRRDQFAASRSVSYGGSRAESPLDEAKYEYVSKCEAPEKDEDLERASELVALHANKETFQRLGDSGLGNAKERVDKIVQELTADRKKVPKDSSLD